MIRALALLGLVVVLMSSARSFLPVGGTAPASAGTALAFGFVLLAALQTGNVFAMLRLPRLTGYLLTGLVCGPELSGLLTERMVGNLGPVNGVAVGLIALSAGCELDLRQLRPRLGSVALIGLIAVPLAMVTAAGVTLAFGERLPFLAGMPFAQRAMVAATLGVVFASLSPAVAIAMLAETGSAGPVSETVLGVVVLADIVIVVVFAVVHALAQGTFGVTGGESLGTVQAVGLEVFGSMAVGAVLALALALYFRRVKAKAALFVLAVCFVSAEVGSRLHFDVLIICLTAGLLLQNVLGVHGEHVTRELGAASLTIFAVFFAVAGAKLHLHDLARVWPMALVFAGARAVSLMAGARLGAVLSRAEPAVRRFAMFGMLPQAGVSVGLAVLIERHFPSWGPGARALILSVITMNELIGPVVLRAALVRAGEAGRRDPDAAAGDH